MGLSVSYDRTMDVWTIFARAVTKSFKNEGVVVPTNCKHGMFSKVTTDNIDVSDRTDMHGTSITLIDHFSKNNTDTDPPPLTLDVSEDTPIELSGEFAVVSLRLPPTRGRLLVFVRFRPPACAGGGGGSGAAAHGHRLSSMSPWYLQNRFFNSFGVQQTGYKY